MTPETELTSDLIERVRKLSPAAREELIILLIDEQLGPADDPELARKEWREDIARRIEDIKAGRVQLLDADEALARLEERLRQRYPR
jgi:hypothetical protein